MTKKFKEMMEKSDRPHPPHHGGDGKHCHPMAHHFTMCVEMNTYKNCPSDRKINSPECTKLNEFIDKCMPKPQM